LALRLPACPMTGLGNDGRGPRCPWSGLDFRRPACPRRVRVWLPPLLPLSRRLSETGHVVMLVGEMGRRSRRAATRDGSQVTPGNSRPRNAWNPRRSSDRQDGPLVRTRPRSSSRPWSSYRASATCERPRGQRRCSTRPRMSLRSAAPGCCDPLRATRSRWSRRASRSTMTAHPSRTHGNPRSTVFRPSRTHFRLPTAIVPLRCGWTRRQVGVHCLTHTPNGLAHEHARDVCRTNQGLSALGDTDPNTPTPP
jgi:hypothetical protein